MKPRLIAKLKAKELVKNLIKSTKKIVVHTSEDELWSWAKEVVERDIDMILSEIPMYQGNLNPNWKYWDDVKSEVKQLA